MNNIRIIKQSSVFWFRWFNSGEKFFYLSYFRAAFVNRFRNKKHHFFFFWLNSGIVFNFINYSRNKISRSDLCPQRLRKFWNYKSESSRRGLQQLVKRRFASGDFIHTKTHKQLYLNPTFREEISHPLQSSYSLVNIRMRREHSGNFFLERV